VIPVCGCVDDNLNAFRRAGCNAAARLIAVLRADIDCWVSRWVTLPQYIGKLGGIIGGEKHIVALEVKALRRRINYPTKGRERAFGRLGWRHRAAGLCPEQRSRNRGGIAVGDDMISLERRSVIKPHCRYPPPLHFNHSTAAAAANVSTAPHRKFSHRARDMVHPPLNRPDARLLDMRDQH
jgi:hypothetical protein